MNGHQTLELLDGAALPIGEGLPGLLKVAAL